MGLIASDLNMAFGQNRHLDSRAEGVALGYGEKAFGQMWRPVRIPMATIDTFAL
jgi:hypothetical protein